MGDFIDVVYSYSVNSPDMRSDFRSAMLGFMFDFKTAAETATKPGFEGFQKSAMSMVDLLDLPASEWSGPDTGLTYTKD